MRRSRTSGIVLLTASLGLAAGLALAASAKVWKPGETTIFPSPAPGEELDQAAEPPVPATLSQETSDYQEQKFIAMVARERYKHIPPQAVVEKLGLRPGMTVVDIGAGVGYFTFDIARAVGPTGKTYATEVDAGMLDRLAAKRDAEGFANIETKLVGTGRLDAFYRGQNFDLAFLSAVFEYLPDPVEFFADLRPCLRPGSGRVVIVHPRMLWRFQDEDFYDYPEIFSGLRSAGEAHPVFRRLEPALQDYLRQWTMPPPTDGAMPVPAIQREAFARAVDKILDDPAFPSEMLAYAERSQFDGVGDLAALLREYTPIFRWLYYAHHDLFDPPRPPATEEERAAVRMINKALVVPLVIGLPYFGGHVFPRAVTLSDRGVIDLMEKAGYRLLRADDTFNYFYFLEFAPNSGT